MTEVNIQEVDKREVSHVTTSYATKKEAFLLGCSTTCSKSRLRYSISRSRSPSRFKTCFGFSSIFLKAS
jgi:hypothetical protein